MRLIAMPSAGGNQRIVRARTPEDVAAYQKQGGKFLSPKQLSAFGRAANAGSATKLAMVQMRRQKMLEFELLVKTGGAIEMRKKKAKKERRLARKRAAELSAFKKMEVTPVRTVVPSTPPVISSYAHIPQDVQAREVQLERDRIGKVVDKASKPGTPTAPLIVRRRRGRMVDVTPTATEPKLAPSPRVKPKPALPTVPLKKGFAGRNKGALIGGAALTGLAAGGYLLKKHRDNKRDIKKMHARMDEGTVKTAKYGLKKIKEPASWAGKRWGELTGSTLRAAKEETGRHHRSAVQRLTEALNRRISSSGPSRRFNRPIPPELGKAISEDRARQLASKLTAAAYHGAAATVPKHAKKVHEIGGKTTRTRAVAGTALVTLTGGEALRRKLSKKGQPMDEGKARIRDGEKMHGKRKVAMMLGRPRLTPLIQDDGSPISKRIQSLVGDTITGKLKRKDGRVY